MVVYNLSTGEVKTVGQLHFWISLGIQVGTLQANKRLYLKGNNNSINNKAGSS